MTIGANKSHGLTLRPMSLPVIERFHSNWGHGLFTLNAALQRLGYPIQRNASSDCGTTLASFKSIRWKSSRDDCTLAGTMVTVTSASS